MGYRHIVEGQYDAIYSPNGLGVAFETVVKMLDEHDALAAQNAELRRALEDLHTAATEFAQEAECDCDHHETNGSDGHPGTFILMRERLHGECERAEKALAAAPSDAVRRVELLEKYWYASNTPPAQRGDMDIRGVIEELRALDGSSDTRRCRACGKPFSTVVMQVAESQAIALKEMFEYWNARGRIPMSDKTPKIRVVNPPAVPVTCHCGNMDEALDVAERMWYCRNCNGYTRMATAEETKEAER